MIPLLRSSAAPGGRRTAPPPRATRTLIAILLPILIPGTLLAGCSGTAADPTAPTAGASAPGRPTQSTTDVDLAVEAVRIERTALTAAEDALTGRARTPVATTRLLTALVELHRSHLVTLQDALPPGTDLGSPGPTPTTSGTAESATALRARVVASERAGAGVLVALAGRAEDGTLARLLGSMAAAVLQRLPHTGATGGTNTTRPATTRPPRTRPPRTLPPRTLPPTTPAGTLEALQQALAAQHAALYLFGFLGAQVSAGRQPDLAAALGADYERHRTTRDLLTGWLEGLGAPPVAAEPSYRLPERLRSARRAPVSAVRSAAAEIETRMAGVSGTLVAAATGGLRGWALQALIDDAVASVGYGAPPSALPGYAAG